MQPFVEAVRHYCEAELWGQAYDVMSEEHLFSVLFTWGENTLRLELYQLFIEGMRRGCQPEQRQSALVYNNLGGVYNALGEKQKALDYFEQALVLRRVVGDRRGEGTTLNNLGAYFLGEKKYELSLACLVLAKNLFIKVQSPNSNAVQRWIDNLQRKVGERQFDQLFAQVEPGAQQIVDGTLGKH